MSEPRSARTEGLLLVGAMVALMWVLEVVDVVAGHRLDAYGIDPRSTDGLAEILTAPWLHFGFGHLLSNTVPFASMGAVIAFNGAARVAAVTAIVVVVSGLGVWLIAPAGTVTLGASGIVFGYATYLLMRGVFNRNGFELAIGIAVAVIWGGALLGSLLPHEGISWQGHFFGAVGGLIAARVLSPARAAAPVPSRA
jgi:membrane associated rhomboid family serine protease